MPILLIFGYRNYPYISKSDNFEFHSKWGSLFLEFKNNKGFLSTQFYTIFICRRLAYIFSQVYLNAHLYLQSFLNIGISLLQLIYVLYYLPYKDSLVMVSSILGELSTTSVIIISILFINQPSLQSQATLSTTMVFFILTSMVGQSFISVIIGFKGMKKHWNKIQRWNAKSFLKSATKTHPISSNDNITNQTDPEICMNRSEIARSYSENFT